VNGYPSSTDDPPQPHASAWGFSFLNSDKRVREDIIKTFNGLAYVGGFTQLAAAAALYYKDGHASGFLAAVGFILSCKAVSWIVMAYES